MLYLEENGCNFVVFNLSTTHCIYFFIILLAIKYVLICASTAFGIQSEDVVSHPQREQVYFQRSYQQSISKNENYFSQ